MTIEEHMERSEIWLHENRNPFAKPTMVWLDLETTSLEVDSGKIIEMGMLVTDNIGNVLPGGVFQEIVYNAGGVNWEKDSTPFVLDMHTKSALVEALKLEPPYSLDVSDVERAAVEFLKGHFGPDMHSLLLPVSGSSVGFDRAWIKARMPKVDALFGHRVIDVSTLWEIAKIRNLPLFEDCGEWKPMKAHRVVPDMIDSIESYRFYTSA